MLSLHDQAGVDELARRLRIEPYRLRRLRNAFYKAHAEPIQSLLELPDETRARFAEAVAFHCLEVDARHDSRRDGASKLILRTVDGLLLEAVVLRIASGRTTLCVSSQVGCAAACGFCATGKMGLARNLRPDEILDQLAQANGLLRSEGRSVRNVVFMGMGEPLHNEAAVSEALEVLTRPDGFALTPRRLVVSTVGVPDALVRLARRFPRVRLALSLHSARQEVRQSLIPLARRHDLTALRAALVEATAIQGQPVFIEYLLLEDRTDTAADVEALTGFLRGLPVHINLIPYNPIDGAPGIRATPLARQKAFALCLRDAGFPVTVRYSLGADVAAACGQLVRAEKRQANVASRPGWPVL